MVYSLQKNYLLEITYFFQFKASRGSFTFRGTISRFDTSTRLYMERSKENPQKRY